MIEAIMIKSNERITFSVAIDSTKVLKLLNINTAHKCIMGRAYPNYLIYTTHLNKDEIIKILNNVKKNESHPIDLASEVKVATICFQNQPKSISPISIISARPQGINETSNFTKNVYQAASKIVKDYTNTTFSNFATDGVSVEMKDIMYTIF